MRRFLTDTRLRQDAFQADRLEGDRGELTYGRPAGRPPRGGWREEVMTASTLNLLAGIWLIIAPWVLAYSAEDPRWNDVVFGAIIALLSLMRISGAYRESWLSWLNAAIGVWVFIAAFTIDQTGTATGNDIVLGVIVFVLALWSASASELRPGRRGREVTAPSSGGYRRNPPLPH